MGRASRLIEIGQQELFGFIARALHEGGTQVEDDRPDTLAEALAALEDGLVRWFEAEGVELGSPTSGSRIIPAFQKHRPSHGGSE